MSEIKRAVLIVSGRVQGVFYRDSTMRKARELNLAGNVQNQPDGTVRIEAQGPPEALKNLIRWAYDGPPAAVVTEVKVSYSPPLPALAGFEVRY
ncbi:MAG: acylphosphatase [Pseudomonadota bacterium]